MYAALERSRAHDVDVIRAHRDYLDRLDVLEQYSLSLPPSARPASGLGLALGIAGEWGELPAPVVHELARDISDDDYWF